MKKKTLFEALLLEHINVEGAVFIGNRHGFDVFDITTFAAAEQFVNYNTGRPAGTCWTQNQGLFDQNINAEHKLFFIVKEDTNKVVIGALQCASTKSYTNIINGVSYTYTMKYELEDYTGATRIPYQNTALSFNADIFQLLPEASLDIQENPEQPGEDIDTPLSTPTVDEEPEELENELEDELEDTLEDESEDSHEEQVDEIPAADAPVVGIPVGKDAIKVAIADWESRNSSNFPCYLARIEDEGLPHYVYKISYTRKFCPTPYALTTYSQVSGRLDDIRGYIVEFENKAAAETAIQGYYSSYASDMVSVPKVLALRWAHAKSHEKRLLTRDANGSIIDAFTGELVKSVETFNTPDLKIKIVGREAVVVGCREKHYPNSEIQIPETTSDGHPITKIASYAFYRWKGAYTIKCPYIKEIANYAFADVQNSLTVLTNKNVKDYKYSYGERVHKVTLD